MSDKKNPFGNFNFSDLMQQAPDNPMMKAWQDNDFVKSAAKMFGQDDEPMDLGELWEMQKKNLSTLTDVNMKMGERMTSLAKQQAELMGEAWETLQHYTKNADGKATEKATEQAQSVFQKAMGNMQDLGKQGVEISTEASEALQGRMKESVDELQELMKKYTK